ncbi:MAG: CpaD family pilus assembly protein [Parvibaculum sp.]|nr:CpaD family pilus assembly protein [Parvibaculum sp.]
MKKQRSVSSLLILPLLASLALAGCGGFNGVEEAQFDASYSHPISVQPDVPTLNIAASSGLSVEDRAALEGFVDAYKERGHGALTVATPSGSSNTAIAMNVLADVRDTLTQSGVPANRVSYTPYRASAANQTAPIIVSYKRFVAVASPCGDWSDSYSYNPNNTPTRNLGCTTQNNLAAMVADPADLVTPRVMTASDAARRGEVFTKYRKGEITATARDDHDSAALSEVAK